MISYEQQLDRIWPAMVEGSVTATDGVSARVACLPVPIGAEVELQRVGLPALSAQVIGFHDGLTHVFPFEEPRGVRIGDRVRLVRTQPTFRVGPQLLGRVLDAKGRSLDGRPAPTALSVACLEAAPPRALQRRSIREPLATGVRVIDGLLTCGAGQRSAIVAGPGLGKSVLLGMLARRSEADVNVVALIGERGREVQEFLDRDLRDGLQRSVVIVATGDESAAMRLRAAMAATTVAEYFREQGLRVQLLFDSLTRVAMAQREIGLSLGELPASRGYPPSVYSLLPRLLERTGASDQGSITAFYSVLVDELGRDDPIGEAARGLLDAHYVLCPRLAQRGLYPAIDVLDSVSRLMPQVADPDHAADAAAVRNALAAKREAEDLIMVGAYRAGSRADVDAALRCEHQLDSFRRQSPDESSSPEATRKQLRELARCLADEHLELRGLPTNP